MPFSPAEAAAIQAQTLRATISDIEVLKLIQMLRTAVLDIMAMAKDDSFRGTKKTDEGKSEYRVKSKQYSKSDELWQRLIQDKYKRG
jgi:hypothetical protein